MQNMKKLLALVLVIAMVAALFVGCQPTDEPNDSKDTTPATGSANPATGDTTPATGDTTPATGDTTEPAVPGEYEGYVAQLDADGKYVRGDDDEIRASVLGDFEALMAKAREATGDERFVLYAQAEAALLDSGLMIPYNTNGGGYQINRVVPRTAPYVKFGADSYRLHTMQICKDFLTPAERADLLDMWAKAVAGEGTYDPVAYLTSKGHEMKSDYVYTFSTAPVTLDWMNTSSTSDTEVLVNTVDGLVEYDNLGNLQPSLAESWDISEDGTVYTFHLRTDAKWFTAEGKEYAPVTAYDFAAGFQHLLDVQAGLEGLAGEGGAEIAGIEAYLKEGASFDTVGYKALDDHTVQITLTKPVPYFMTMLTYNIFLPICKPFYESKGGVFGHEAYEEAIQDTSKYTYGMNTDVSSQVYCGPYLLQKLLPDSEIYLAKNPNYYDAATTTLNSIKAVYDDGSNNKAYYDDVVNGVYDTCGLAESTGLLKIAKDDGNFEKYAYIADTDSTTFFGGLNVNRGAYALESGNCASPKTEQQKADTVTALNNKNFRKAMMYAFNKKAMGAASRGEELATTNSRNMYCHPEFVKLENDYTDEDGHTFAANTFYGEIVQYYCDKLGLGIDVRDGVDGWYHADLAKAALEKAKAELGDKVTFPITIDLVYYSASDSNTVVAQTYKTNIEETLGAENVVVNLIEATTTDDYFYSGYRAPTGAAGNFDIFYGSGWGPDYGDPCTYLNTFDGNVDGYMLKVIGLY